MTSSADTVLSNLAGDVNPTVDTMLETVRSPLEHTEVPKMDNEGLSKLFGVYAREEKYDGSKLSFRRINELAGLKSLSHIQKLYKECSILRSSMELFV
jgi:hypothetical protein